VGWAVGSPAPLDGVDAVVHAAAHRPAAYADPGAAAACLTVNAVGTSALVEQAAAAGVRRFVYLSAGNVYRPLGRPAQEDDPIWPSHRAPYYLGSKICGEFFVSAATEAGRIAAVSLRPSAIYGPGMPAGLVSTLVGRLRAGQGVTLADGGRYEADLVAVDDVVDAIVAALARPVSGAVNVGSGTTVTAAVLARTVAALVGADPASITIEPERGDPPGFVALDVRRAQAELGITPRSLAVGLQRMVT
ncbi:MAG: NAD-dependent epimerase/dehydratase family protein, partial [Myxococcota bacterium]